ncbi:MAG: hypothetical protein PUB87_04820 [Eubacteriaceae bacterium]|nr:hypothetical protein [Eubacteriaceae bacterium]
MKSFLEEYGLIIVVAVIVIALVALAGTFGTEIMDAIQDLIDKFLGIVDAELPAGGETV